MPGHYSTAALLLAAKLYMGLERLRGRAVHVRMRHVMSLCERNMSNGLADQRVHLSMGRSAPHENARLTVTVKTGNVVDPPATSLECAGCDTACSAGDNPCGKEPVYSVKVFPGTWTVYLISGFLSGWYLLIEVDVQRPAPNARICRLAGTDALSCTSPHPPECAVAGSLTLRQMPSAQLVEMPGELSAVFSDNVTITGRFK